MFNNTGPYGPNDTPTTMGAPVNMSHINGVNVVSNFGKFPQETIHSPSGHYNLPSYTPYGPAAFNMRPPMSQFSNYHQVSFQPNFAGHNSTSSHITPWHSGIPPMNLNLQHSRDTNMFNFPQNSEKTPQPVINSESFQRDVPMNVPRIQTKNLHKYVLNNDINKESYVHQKESYVNQKEGYVNQKEGYVNQKDSYVNQNVSMKNDLSQMDDTRRRSLETTVKLIENILINSTRKTKESPTNISDTSNVKDKDPLSMNTEKEMAENKTLKNHNTTTNKKPDILPEHVKDTASSDSQSSSSNENNTESNPLKDQEEPKEIPIEIMSQSSEDKLVNNIEIKLEPANWIDTESFTPFRKDENGVTRDDVGDCDIVEADMSVSQATGVIRNGLSTRFYYECPHCGLLFNHPKRFLIHTKWHIFGITSDRKAELARKRDQRRRQRKQAKEAQKLNPKVKDEPQEYPCKECNKMFTSSTNLKKHRYRCHSIRECKVCRVSINGWAAWQEHLSAHSADKKATETVEETWHQCSDCPKKYKYPHTLAKHRDTHLEKTHACADCPKKFGSQKLLRVHVKTHERALRGVRFRCTYCGKGYLEAYTLQVHERTHRNERPFSCETCSSTFVSNSGLKRHIKVSHSASKPFECSICHRSFVSESIRDNHQLRAHGSPEDFDYPCKECPSRFGQLKNLRKHMYKVHPKGKSRKKAKSDSE